MTLIERFDSEEQLKDYLVEEALKKYSWQFGLESKSWWPFLELDIDLDISFGVSVSGDLATADAEPVAFGGGAMAEVDAYTFSASADGFSETNTQEEGVDEADLIETDGEYIYQVANGSLTIVDARNPEQLSLASQMDLSDLGNIQGAYLYEDQLTVISTWSLFWSLFHYEPFGNYHSTVNVTVLDVSDPTSVELEETSRLDGTLLSSRAIGDQVYVVTKAPFGLPGPELKDKEYEPPTKPVPVELSQKVVASDISFAPLYPYPVATYKYETQEEYLARIEGQELDLALANFTTVDDQGQLLREGLLSEAQNIYKPLDDKKPSNLAYVSVFDVDDNQPGPNSSTGIPTNNLGEVYMSRDNLYLLERDWSWQAEQTSLLKVDLNPLELVAVGEVPGRVLDQFSVDEEEGYLRVATTTGSGWYAQNNLYVLQQEGQDLEIAGSIEGIAPGETIRSARFQDDYGFVVTFRQVDPFFTLDLSEPTNPQVAGELKLPGFSEYLQVIENGDNTQVLGIGRDADLLGRPRGLKVSLFDVTDFENPQEVDSFLFEGKYSSSEAQWDHRAVSYFPEFNTLAIPFSTSSEKGLRLFDVDAEEGFTVLGDITHEGDRIRRSLRIGDDLYAISNDRITVHDLETLELVDEVILSGADGKENPFLDFLAVGGLDVFTQPVSVADTFV